MRKLILLLLFIPLVFSCSSTDDVSKTPEIKGQYKKNNYERINF